MKDPIFLQPVLQTKIWGGRKLATEFGMSLPNDTIGESWSISAHPNGVSIVVAPAKYQGVGLDELYRQHPELFGDEQLTEFPLLIKILDAAEDLSVQVHPNDIYAREHEGELGKTECWYVISAEPGAKIVYGHNAQTPEEFANLVQKGEWSALLREVPVKAGDFFYVPYGTIHAIGAGIVILETQQNSDTTYRVYDYARTDDSGQPRPLHIQQSIDVTMFPHQDPELTISELNVEGNKVTHYLTNEYFSVYKWAIKDEATITLKAPYSLANVIAGAGKLKIEDKEYDLQLADSFILPSEVREVELIGELTLIVSNPE
ncbi:mannose-6-phosphate isomerase, class I [Aerococcaceae bacterium NML191219]|nr:mannose-6-phosphate isomerase, class I [Aerococcaceae bacterium NML191219]